MECTSVRIYRAEGPVLYCTSTEIFDINSLELLGDITGEVIVGADLRYTSWENVQKGG